MSLRTTLLLSTLCLLSALTHPTWAQRTATPTPAPEGGELAPASQYFVSGAPAGSFMIDINVWGQVGRPGQYRVPDTTDLITLISVAGGPIQGARISHVRIVRNTKDYSGVLSVDMKKYIETADKTAIPPLRPGDTVIVSATFPTLLSRAARFIADTFIIVNVILLLR